MCFILLSCLNSMFCLLFCNLTTWVMGVAHNHSIRAKVTNSPSDPEHELPSGILSICPCVSPALPAYPVLLYHARDNRESQSICALSQLAWGYESDLIMLLHYYLMPWTLLENRFVIVCSHTVFIMIWQAAMPAEIQRPVAIYTWFWKQQVIRWWSWRLSSVTLFDAGVRNCLLATQNVTFPAFSPLCSVFLTMIRWSCRRMLKIFGLTFLFCLIGHFFLKGFSWCTLSTRMRQSTLARYSITLHKWPFSEESANQKQGSNYYTVTERDSERMIQGEYLIVVCPSKIAVLAVFPLFIKLQSCICLLNLNKSWLYKASSQT